MARTIPTINTPRITLRSMRAEDFNRFAEIWAIPQVVAHMPGKPYTRAASWDTFLRIAGHWQVVGFGEWAAQVHGNTAMQGQCGFYFGARGLGEDFDPYPEAGWILDPHLHGKGLGLEMAGAAHDWFDRVVTGRTVCMIGPDNTPSLRLAAKLGYSQLREVEHKGAPALLFTRKGPPV